MLKYLGYWLYREGSEAAWSQHSAGAWQCWEWLIFIHWSSFPRYQLPPCPARQQWLHLHIRSLLRYHHQTLPALWSPAAPSPSTYRGYPFHGHNCAGLCINALEWKEIYSQSVASNPPPIQPKSCKQNSETQWAKSRVANKGPFTNDVATLNNQW